MLRYKKHRRHADGLSGSGVGVMDDTDIEVSSFTDRAFRSLCVAEEEPFNDVPHIPSPISGMPLSTKYHLGIFNLSVRKTQPLAQLPSISRQRAKWAPTFQPLLAKDGLIVAKTNTNKLCVPKPTDYKSCSKVTSLIRSFDNIENESPEPDGFSLSKGIQRGKINEEEICQKVEHRDLNNVALESINPNDTSHNLHRRTAREVFLESQAEICPRLSASPCSSGSPLPDQAKKIVTQKEYLRRTAFLHSENSAFKSWNDINRRHPGGEDSDSPVPGTPILRSATPCSPLLQRTTPGVRARDAGQEVGWASPASTLSNSFDAIQMLRTVPPLPNKRITKQSRELSHRVPKCYADYKIQAEDIQVDLGYQLPKEQKGNLAKSKKCKQALNPNQEQESISENISHNLPKQNEDLQEKVDPLQEARKLEAPAKEDDIKLSNKPIIPSGRIKTLIKQIENETIKDAVPLYLPEKIFNLKDSNEASMELLSSTLQEKRHDSDLNLNRNVQTTPWRRIHVYKTDLEDKLLKNSIRESAKEHAEENMTASEEYTFEDKPSISSFNITNLLTPVIRRKSIQEALEEQHMTITPPPADTKTLNDQDQREISLYHKRNEYKSKATSLLFNLKDMRKRVKSTYNPSINVRNGPESVQTTDSRVQEISTHGIQSPGIPLMETGKQVLELENVRKTDQTYVPRLTNEEEYKHDYLENPSEDYLCLSSPSNVVPCKVFENAEMSTEDVNTDIHEQLLLSSNLNPSEHNPTNNSDYPTLNSYPTKDTSEKVDQKPDTPTKPACRQKKEELPFHGDNVKPDDKQREPFDFQMISSFEECVKNEPDTKQSLSSQEMVNQCLAKSDEGEKQRIKDDSQRDDLQYYAVSNGNIENGKVQRDIPKEKNDEKVEDKEPLVSDKGKEITNTVEIKSPSSIVQFKPNLFHIKDNKIKSSSVTKSVRPLLRSLSEDCLFFHKGDDHSITVGKEDFRVTTPSSWKNRDAKIDISTKRNMVAHNGEKRLNHVNTQPILASSDHNNIESKQIKKQHEEREIQELWDPDCMTPDWNKNEEDVQKVNKNCTSPLLIGPFFHPVETCVSEVTGLSPECNTLLVHHGHDSIKDLINGEHASSPLLDSANTNYSPLENGLQQFEDAISFSEDIACSTVTSPMSESITCSMVASPMSVNTQSSGFTTALSVLDDIPNSPLTSISSRNGKCNRFIHDDISTVPTPSSNFENKSKECIEQPQEQLPCVDSLKAHAAKPPTVPPKTEKALRRAKRLTKKRRKSEFPPKIHELDFQESDFVLDVPAPVNIIPSSMNPQSNFKVGSCISKTLQPDESISEASTPSLPTTQRKLLQDPDSGQYFVVDIPVHFRIKTFFDPETGKYLQMSLPPSERSTPALEMSNSPFMLYQGLAPVPVTSIASLKKKSELLNHSGLYIGEKPGSWPEAADDCLKMQQFIDLDSCDQSIASTPNMHRNTRTISPDIISMADIDDFAMEAIS